MKTSVLHTCAAVALALCFSAAPLSAVPTEWTVASGGNGHFYELFTTPLTWDLAQAAAVAQGGHLATLLSRAENDFVFTLSGNLGPWLGGFQPPGSAGEPADGWQWVNNEGPFVFTNWNTGEPNNFGEEDFLHFTGNGVWNDLPATSARAYIVEITPRQVPPVNGVPEGGSALAFLSVALLGLEGLRRRFAAA